VLVTSRDCGAAKIAAAVGVSAARCPVRQGHPCCTPVAACGDRLIPTRAYVTRRSKAGLSKTEIIRCLKRYIAREVYRHLRAGAG